MGAREALSGRPAELRSAWDTFGCWPVLDAGPPSESGQSWLPRAAAVLNGSGAFAAC